MNQPRPTGPATVAGGAAAAGGLPVTGSGIVSLVLIGLALLVAGLLLIRSSRYRRAED
jgi:LPXTG-motif cell wall-anchored protein